MRTLLPQSFIGIDITPIAVHIIQLSFCWGRWRVEYFASEKLPTFSITNNEIKDVRLISNCIQRLFRLFPKQYMVRKSVRLSIPDTLTITAKIQVSKALSEEDIESLVLLKASQELVLPLTEVNVDFNLLLNRDYRSFIKEINLIATGSKAIKQREEIVSRAGLKVKKIEPESHSIIRVIDHHSQKIPKEKLSEEIIGVININIFFINLYIVSRGEVIFKKDKKIEGFLQERSTEGFYEKRNWDNFIEEILNVKDGIRSQTDLSIGFVLWLICQIKILLELFYRTIANCKVKYFFLIGDFAVFPELMEKLKIQCCIDISLLNIFHGMEFSRRINKTILLKNSPTLFIALGSALN